MSFRLNDLKKSVRKTKEGHQVTPVVLEGRPAAFRIEFLLQQFEGHVGCPRRMLDPAALLDFVGDPRLGRGLLATLAQWYRVRPRTFAEALSDGGAGLREHGIAGPVDLRAWLYTAANRGGGYLDPVAEALFWQGQSRALDVRCEALQKLTLLDRPEEAVLVRTGPPPGAADVIAAYNARAHTTLLRSAAEVGLQCDAPAAVVERAARAWAGEWGVEWTREGGALRLLGRADAHGSWTRHGRQVERVALELLGLPELGVRELSGRVEIGERSCRFRWKAGTLALAGAGAGGPLDEGLPARVAALAAALRREREGAGEWGIRRASHPVGVAGGLFLPHLELRRGDMALYLRLAGPEHPLAAAGRLAPFLGKTPVALIAWPGDEEPAVLQLPGEEPVLAAQGGVLGILGDRLEAARSSLDAGRSVRRAA